MNEHDGPELIIWSEGTRQCVLWMVGDSQEGFLRSPRPTENSPTLRHSIYTSPRKKAGASGHSQLARRLSTKVLCTMPTLPSGTLDPDGDEPLVALLPVLSVRAALARATPSGRATGFRRLGRSRLADESTAEQDL